jgi:transposase InsO family protein
MAQRGVHVNTKLAAILARRATFEQVEPGQLGPVLSVTQICRQLSISRTTFYTAEQAFAEFGIEGLLPKSRRPHRSPRQIPAELEDAIVAARKELTEQGWDNGAETIAKRLVAKGVTPPSIPTINRALKRRGMVEPQPQKRPNKANKRFGYDERNACWQIDAFHWRLADGTAVAIFQLIDDCTRLELAPFVALAETGDAALACFLAGVVRWGVPAMLLSDNGLAFTGRNRWRSSLEEAAAALGCRTVQSSPYHPQTCGKNERAHQTMQRWLRARPPAADIAELQALLEVYQDAYNDDRPHQALGGLTPTQAAAGVAVAQPAAAIPEPEEKVIYLVVKRGGDIAVKDWALSVGRRYKGRTVAVIQNGDHLAVILDNKLLRELTLDRSRNFQPRKPAPGPTDPNQALSTMS